MHKNKHYRDPWKARSIDFLGGLCLKFFIADQIPFGNGMQGRVSRLIVLRYWRFHLDDEKVGSSPSRYRRFHMEDGRQNDWSLIQRPLKKSSSSMLLGNSQMLDTLLNKYMYVAAKLCLISKSLNGQFKSKYT